MKERRTQRSDDPIKAAEMYLNAAAERRDYRALALADSNGRMVARSATSLDANALAAVAPYAHETPETDQGLLGLITRGDAFRVWDVDVHGHPHYLAAVGGSEHPPSELERTLRRILN